MNFPSLSARTFRATQFDILYGGQCFRGLIQRIDSFYFTIAHHFLQLYATRSNSRILYNSIQRSSVSISYITPFKSFLQRSLSPLDPPNAVELPEKAAALGREQTDGVLFPRSASALLRDPVGEFDASLLNLERLVRRKPAETFGLHAGAG